MSEFPNVNTSLAYTEASSNPFTFTNNGGGRGSSGGSSDGGSGGSSEHNQELDLDCACSYAVDGNNVRIQVGRISNNRNGGVSGTLKLKLWATTSEYSGGPINGYTLSSINLGQLQGGFYFSDINQTTRFSEPPPGEYYFTLTLTEYKDGQDFIVDYVTFSGTKTIDAGYSGVGAGGGSGSGSDNGIGTGNITFNCPCTINYSGDSVRLDVSQVSNTRVGGTSGTLKLKIWATSTPYISGTINGYTVAEFNLGSLDGGFIFQDVSRTTTITRPPNGTYYITATLTEFNGQDLIVDSVNFDQQRTFTAPVSGGTNLGLGSGLSSGSSGGSMSILLPFLILISLLRIKDRQKM